MSFLVKDDLCSLGTTQVKAYLSTDVGLTVKANDSGSTSALMQCQDASGNVVWSVQNPNFSQSALTNQRALDVEPVMGYAGTTTVTGSVAAIRGNMTVAAGTTTSASAFVYGTQGKLTIKGTMNSTSGWLTGVIGQLDISSATLTAGNLSAGWFDAGASATATTAANMDIVRITNSTGCKGNSMLFMSGNATYGIYFDDQSSGWITGTTASTAGGCIKIHTPAGVRYLQAFTTAT